MFTAKLPRWRPSRETLARPDAGDVRQVQRVAREIPGQLVDLGGKLGAGRLATAEPVPDGPLVEVKELVGGYMIVSAASLEEALQVARECPGLVRAGSGVEVIEIHSPG